MVSLPSRERSKLLWSAFAPSELRRANHPHVPHGVRGQRLRQLTERDGWHSGMGVWRRGSPIPVSVRITPSRRETARSLAS
jgi:hypothetical protein